MSVVHSRPTLRPVHSTPRRSRIVALFGILSLVLLSLSACSEGVSATRAPSILFSATARNAVVSLTGPEDGSLTLDASTPVLWFADRPGRTAGSMTIEDLVNGWEVNGFDADPPNAALVISTADTTTQHVVVLGSPSLVGTTVSFAFTVNAEGEEAGITHVHDIVSGTFDRVELFIDDAAIPECPTYITAKAHSLTKCVISPGDGNDKTYQFDQAGLTGTFQLCATQPGLSGYGDWYITECPTQVEMYTRPPRDGPDTYEVAGKSPVIVTATFHGKSKIPKWKPPVGGDSADGAEGGPDDVD